MTAIDERIARVRFTADGLVDYVERIVRRYDADHAPGETFAEWTHRADAEDLT